MLATIRATVLFIVATVLALVSGTPAQQKLGITRPKNSPAAPLGRMAADPAIVAALKQVSAAHIRELDEKLVSFHNRSTLSSDQPASSGRGIVAARDWIRSEFERYSKDCGGCLEVKFDTFTQQPGERVVKPTEISNVYAILRGTDPEQAKRIFLVTGHYDSRDSSNEDTQGEAPGANDDASGTCVSLESARVLSKLKFPATIIFLTVAGEEQGLYGSKHFAEMAKQNGWQIEAALNNDIVGGNRTPGDTLQNPHTVRVFSEGVPIAATDKDLKLIRALGGENDSPSRELARTIAEVAQAYMPASFQPTLIFRLDRYLRGGDHISFNQQAFTAVRFTEWREDYNHQHQNIRVENGIQYGDLPRFVDFDYVANVTRLNAATLAELSSAPPPPAKVVLETKQLENVSTLTWDTATGRAEHYEVLWRDTDATSWGHAEPVPARSCTAFDGQRTEAAGAANAGTITTGWGGIICQATIPTSKDNVIFAVRSVDAKGHVSLPVVPEPER